MNAPVQCALPAWLGGRAAIQQQIRSRVAANLAELDRQLAAAARPSTASKSKAAGTPSCAFPPSSPTSKPSLRCSTAASGSIPATFSACRESGWLVLSLLAPEEEFSTGVSILVNYFLQRIKRSNMTARSGFKYYLK